MHIKKSSVPLDRYVSVSFAPAVSTPITHSLTHPLLLLLPCHPVIPQIPSIHYKDSCGKSCVKPSKIVLVVLQEDTQDNLTPGQGTGDQPNGERVIIRLESCLMFNMFHQCVHTQMYDSG